MAVRLFKTKMKNGALCNVNPNKEQQKLFDSSKVSVDNCLLFLSYSLSSPCTFSQIASTTNCCRCKWVATTNNGKWGQTCAAIISFPTSSTVFAKSGKDKVKIIVLGWKSSFSLTPSRVCLMSDVSALRKCKVGEHVCSWVFINAICMRAGEKKFFLREGSKWTAKRSKGRRCRSERLMRCKFRAGFSLYTLAA